MTGPSDAGKPTLMRMIYGNYLAAAGRISVGGTDVATAALRDIARLRRRTPGYVSQLPQVAPRAPTTAAIVAEPFINAGVAPEMFKARARALLTRLRIPQALWGLSPLTFSGGGVRRANIARGFAHDYPAPLLDETAARFDDDNRAMVPGLIREWKARGAAIAGIFHNRAARVEVCGREVDAPRAAA